MHSFRFKKCLCFSDYEGFSQLSKLLKEETLLHQDALVKFHFILQVKVVFLEDLDEKTLIILNRGIDLLENQGLLNKMRDESRKYLSTLFKGNIFKDIH